MKKILYFFVGVACALALVGGVAAWYFYSSPDAIKRAAKNPIVLSIPAPKTVAPPAPAKEEETSSTEGETGNVLSSADDTHAKGAPLPPSGIFLEGSVSVPPILAKIIAKKTDLLLTVRAFKGSIVPGRGIIVNSADIVKPAFPFYYRFQVAPAFVPELASGANETLIIQASICYDRNERSCTGYPAPELIGFIKEQVRIPAGAKPAQLLEMPPLIANRLLPPLDAAACARQGSTISGTIQPTPQFLAAPGEHDKFVVMAIPVFGKHPPPPYGQGAGSGKPLSMEEVARMKNFGIVSNLVSFKEKTAVNFSFKLEEKFSNAYYRIYAAPCNSVESEENCLSHSFPYTPIARFGDIARNGGFGLVPKGLMIPTCGAKGIVLYIHKWLANAPAPSDAALSSASPPEIIEGVFN